MRKLNSLLVFIAMLTAFTASPRNFVSLATTEDLEAAGISSTKTDIPGGTVVLDNEAGTFMLAYDDYWGTSPAYKDYRNVRVEGEEIFLGSGVAGNTNPVFTSYQQGAPTAGAVFEIIAKKDGWMTVFTKINPNKQYLVFEGQTGAIPYTLGAAGMDYKINYTLPSYTSGSNAGFIDFSDAETSNYFTAVSPGQYNPQLPYIVSSMESSPAEGTGFLTFKVKTGNKYYVSGIGTKMVCQGFILTESEQAPTVSFCATEELSEVQFQVNLEEPFVKGPHTPEIIEPVVSGNSLVVLASLEDLENIGLSSGGKIDLPGGTVIVNTEAGSLSLAYDDAWGRDISYANYQNIRVGDSEEIILGRGAVGNTNPVFESYQQGAPSAGAVFEIKAKKDGWMTVFTKMNPNKQYLVFEGKTNAVAYTLGVAGTDYMINYTLPSIDSGENTGFIDFDASDAAVYFIPATKQMTNEYGVKLWHDAEGNIVASTDKPEGGQALTEDIPGQFKPQFPYLVADMESIPEASTGFMTFKVKAGKTYYVSGIGTKMVCQGFVLTEATAAPTVTFCATEDLPEVKFETGLRAPELEEEFVYNGIWYTVVDADAKTCRTKDSANAVAGDVIIPMQVSNGSTVYDVIGIGAHSFSGNADLLSVTLPATITEIGIGAFSNCERLTSLVWQGLRMVPARVIEEIGNPNLLLYVDNLLFASDIHGCLIVADGICELLDLTPGYPFSPIKSFTANHSRMVKSFTQRTYIGTCAGWESIVLPFDVSDVYADNLDKSLTPFAALPGDSELRHYWLYEGDEDGLWKEAYEIRAGIPYIISMPNSYSYPASYNVDGPVVFSNDSPQLITPENAVPYTVNWAEGRQFRSLWLPLSETEAEKAMGLNVGISGLRDDDGELLPPGSAFHEGVIPQPLEAYVTKIGAERAMRISGEKSGLIPIIADGDIEMRAEDGRMYVRSMTDRIVNVFTADGAAVRVLRLRAGVTAIVDDLTSGIYIAAGRKIIVR